MLISPGKRRCSYPTVIAGLTGNPPAREDVSRDFAPSKILLLDAMRPQACGIFLTHYIFIIWLQYAVCGFSWPAGAKAAVVFAGTLSLSWALTGMLRKIPFVARMI
jgi:surface polysaccharide O-acyltransferase-like enzyme